MPHHNPNKLPLLNIAGKCYKTQSEAAKRLGCSQPLMSRASKVNPYTTHLVNTKYPANTKRERHNTNEQLLQAKNVIEELVPENSAHVRKMDQTITNLYNQYIANVPDVKQPLGKSYFTRLTHEMRIRLQKTVIQCKYCFNLNGMSIEIDIT